MGSKRANCSDKTIIYENLSLEIRGVGVNIATARTIGNLDSIVFLHGFGSTKEDFVDMIYYPAFAGRPLYAFDAPGCGESVCDDPSKVTIPFLVETFRTALDLQGVEKFHLVGHSMGGLTALLLAFEDQSRILSFIDIKGNLGPEDCFLSRQIVNYPSDESKVFFDGFIERTKRAPSRSSALYATSLRYKVRPEVVSPIFHSMVDLSDNGDLLAKFLSLPCPRMFMYGEENASLSYLSTLAANSVRLAEIRDSGHFPMYSNPVAMWSEIASFLGSAS